MNEVKSESTEEVINVVQTADTTEEVTMSESYEEQTIEEHMSEVKEEHAYQQSIQETIVQEEHFEQQFSAEEHQSKSQKVSRQFRSLFRDNWTSLYRYCSIEECDFNFESRFYSSKLDYDLQ